MRQFLAFALTCLPLVCIGAPSYTSYFNNTYVYTNTTSITLLSSVNGAINVKAPPYNASGDGTTDDTAAFTAAIAAGSVIFIPPGTYSVDPISVSGKYLYGVGKASQLTLRTPTSGEVLITSSGSTTIRDIYLTGGTNASFKTSTPPLTTTGIVHSAVADGKVLNVFLDGFETGLAITGTDSPSTRPQNAFYSDVDTTNCFTGIYAASTNQAEYVRISNASLRQGYVGFRNETAANILFIGNRISDMTDAGILVNAWNGGVSAKGHTIYTGNQINHTTGLWWTNANNVHFIANQMLGGGKIHVVTSTNALIANNTFETTTGPTLGGNGVVLRDNQFVQGSTTTVSSSGTVLTFGNYSRGSALAMGSTLEGTRTEQWFKATSRFAVDSRWQLLGGSADGEMLFGKWGTENHTNSLVFSTTENASAVRLDGEGTKLVVRTGNGSADARFGANDLILSKTITPAATTGNQTINKASGSVNFAAAAQTITVTCSLVDANSVIMATVATDDTTAKSCIAVPGSGSFVLKLNAAATAETRVNFLITN